MKKSLVLAMAMALGVTASAYAANPFSDVPAGHWAYDSISKLAAAGVIEGYGDDTFRGDRLMTRYEMAQIVARAMAKGANVDKLAAEFADELEKLNVRVAALEKKSDNVKITGEIRFHYGASNRNVMEADRKNETGLRTRIFVNGQINDNWKYVGRLQNQQWFNNYVGDDGDYSFGIAKVEGRLGGVNIIAGRDDDIFANGYIYDGGYEALKLSYGDKWYVSGAYGKLTDLNDNVAPLVYSKKFATFEIGTNLADSFANGKAGYLTAKLNNGADFEGSKLGIWYVGADFNLTKDIALNAMYLRANKDSANGTETSKNGYVIGLGYKGADRSEPGSWGLAARYYDQGRGTYLAHTIDGDTGWDSGFKGWSFGGDVALAKNIVVGVTYYHTKAKGDAAGRDPKSNVLWSELNLTF